MHEVADALAEVLSRVRRLAAGNATFSPTSLGRVLAEDVRADADSPPFDKSLRDGYAVRAADCAARNSELRYLKQVAEIAAGAVPTAPVGPGECARIFTGAPIPAGADAVVMQEDTQPLADGVVWIKDGNVRPRQWVFARGAETRAGDVVVPAGTAVNPATLGVLASVGAVVGPFYGPARVRVIATGNELVDPHRTPEPGQIRNSNGPMLTALAVRAGAEASEPDILRDDPDEMRRVIGEALASDVLILAGGVSVGKFDLVPQILEELGVAAHVRQVRMKPGKPLLFGTRDRTLVFGLPGNPVSAFVCFELFVRPALRAIAGDPDPGPRVTSLPLAEAVAEANDRPTYRPAKLEFGPAGVAVRPLPWLGAPDLRGLRSADALLVLPPGEARFDPGRPAPVVIIG